MGWVRCGWVGGCDVSKGLKLVNGSVGSGEFMGLEWVDNGWIGDDIGWSAERRLGEGELQIMSFKQLEGED